MLRAWRREKELTQAQAGELFGVHQTTISEWEQGREMTVSHAVAMSRLAGIPIEAWTEPYLLGASAAVGTSAGVGQSAEVDTSAATGSAT